LENLKKRKLSRYYFLQKRVVYLAGVQMVDFLREIVSGKRKRLRLASGLTLDLSYVTPQLIAMSFPASSIEAMYRNQIKDVAKFLNERHGNGYMIYNLSEREYDQSLFDYRVVSAGWPDHMTAPLHVYIEICHAIDSWLASDKSRVAVVHCLAGKGRTGAACASYLVYSSISSSNSEDTMSIRERVFYAEKSAAAEVAATAAGAEIITDLDEQDDEEGVDEDDNEDEENEEEEDDDSDESNDDDGEMSKNFFERDNVNALHEVLAAEYNVPSASEMAARAMKTFLDARGDGLGYAAQKRSVHYVARLVRSTILTAIADSKSCVDPTFLNDSKSSQDPAAPSMDGLFRHWSQAEKAVHLLKAPSPLSIQIHTIIFRAVPKMSGTFFKPFLTFQPQPHQDMLDDSVFSSFNDELRKYHQLDGSCVFNLNECVVSGDVLLRCMSVSEKGKVKECFRYSFNTTMLHDTENSGQGDKTMYHVIIERDMIDMNKRRRNMKRRIPLDFAFDLYYSLSGNNKNKVDEENSKILIDKKDIHPTVACDERLYSAEHIVEQAVLSSQIRGNSIGYTV
jgi:hypothetical protein